MILLNRVALIVLACKQGWEEIEKWRGNFRKLWNLRNWEEIIRMKSAWAEAPQLKPPWCWIYAGKKSSPWIKKSFAHNSCSLNQTAKLTHKIHPPKQKTDVETTNTNAGMQIQNSKPVLLVWREQSKWGRVRVKINVNNVLEEPILSQSVKLGPWTKHGKMSTMR